MKPPPSIVRPISGLNISVATPVRPGPMTASAASLRRPSIRLMPPRATAARDG